MGGGEGQTECEGYLFNSFVCKVKESHNSKVRATGRENYVRTGGVGCSCAGRRELKRKSGVTEEEESMRESFEGDGRD